eukprot:SAG31_NODE_25437_length_461_cov_1.102210_1_plen_87_part_01
MLKDNGSDYNLFWVDSPHSYLAFPWGQGGRVNFSTWQQRCFFDEHSKAADPLFVDAAEGDFRLRSGSPALALGFERLPLKQMTAPEP